MSAAVIAIGALSPLGRGIAAFDVTQLGEPARVAIARDDQLVRLGFAKPFAARVPEASLSSARIDGDRATHLLFDAFSDALDELVAARPSFRSERIGVAIGTSSGGMLTAEKIFSARHLGQPLDPELARSCTYFAPFERVLCEIGLPEPTRRVQLVTACAASTWSIGLALRWLQLGEVDIAFAGSYDALGPFVAAGFESLRATTASSPAPFRLGRDGMSLGEGAGIVALVRGDDLRGASARFFVTGFGASTDAVHITAPDRTGDGLARAARAALSDAHVAPERVESVSVHGTSTPYNDAMEARAIATVFGAHSPVVHPFKAQIGHTLGAAGVLETLAAGHAMAERVLPAAAGSGELDPDATVTLLERAASAAPSSAPCVLKQSAAFGGANAALVLESVKPRGEIDLRPSRPVYLSRAAHVDAADVALIARASGAPADRVARFDELSLLAATSVARLLLGDDEAADSAALSLVRGGGVIVGHAFATLDINDRFFSRVLSRGPTSAEPRLFPPTSPNLVPGQLAILFGLTGPSAAACGSLSGGIEALGVAHDLVAAGDVDKVVVVGMDLLGAASREVIEAGFVSPTFRGLEDGAVALLLEADSTHALRELSSPWTTPSPPSAIGHAGLRELLGLPARAFSKRIDSSPT
jgi:3-oxoacyl-[acyl-carrier-protein] synthase-1/3-oxoacyl-[acyl-carrier-protein] synthase II